MYALKYKHAIDNYKVQGKYSTYEKVQVHAKLQYMPIKQDDKVFRPVTLPKTFRNVTKVVRFGTTLNTAKNSVFYMQM